MKPHHLLVAGSTFAFLFLLAQCADESAWKSRIIYQALTHGTISFQFAAHPYFEGADG